MGGGRSLYVGRLPPLAAHRFAANAVLVGLDDSFELDFGDRVERHDAAFVQGWQWHGVDFHGGRAATLFLEPGARPRRPVHARTLRRIVEATLRARGPGAWAELFRNALGLDAVPSDVDARVARVARLLSDPDASRTSATRLAERSRVSVSQIEHQFRDQLGVPIGAYGAWYRMQAAAELALLGHDLTESAHAMGYYDSAHFSRQFHRMFGLPPSKVFTPGLTGGVVEAPW